MWNNNGTNISMYDRQQATAGQPARQLANTINATLQNAVNRHNPDHSFSCAKSAKAKHTSSCRHNMPASPKDRTDVELFTRKQVEEETKQKVSPDVLNPLTTLRELKAAGKQPDPLEIVAMRVHHKRRLPHIYIAQTCPDLLSAFMSNSFVKYVDDNRLAYYLTAYASKAQMDANALWKAAQDLLDRLAARQEQSMPNDPHAKGFKALLLSVFSHMGQVIVAAPKAGWFLLGHSSYEFSHDFADMPVAQAVALLKGEEVHGIVVNKQLRAASVDYKFRPEQLGNLSGLSLLPSTNACQDRRIKEKQAMSCCRSSLTIRTRKTVLYANVVCLPFQKLVVLVRQTRAGWWTPIGI